jgi:hypothetical protein
VPDAKPTEAVFTGVSQKTYKETKKRRAGAGTFAQGSFYCSREYGRGGSHSPRFFICLRMPEGKTEKWIK